jgi:hypothetical protein
MPNQIFASNSSGIIRRGGGIVAAAKNSQIGGVAIDTKEQTKPVLSEIENKYENRFDDPSYYYGSYGVDGGDVA